MTELITIYVKLLDEAVDVKRPVHATHLEDQTYQIVEQEYDPDIECWEFQPGDRVICEIVETPEGPILEAKKRVDNSSQS